MQLLIKQYNQVLLFTIYISTVSQNYCVGLVGHYAFIISCRSVTTLCAWVVLNYVVTI